MTYLPESTTHLLEQLSKALQAKNICMTAAESCTGGSIAMALTELAGSSQWFERGFVTYSNKAKHEMLGVNNATLESYGAVSEQVVREMVLGAIRHSDSDLAVAVSGVAGPSGGSDEKPVGTVWIAWGNEINLHAVCYLFKGDRAAIRQQTVEQALLNGLNWLKSV